MSSIEEKIAEKGIQFPHSRSPRDWNLTKIAMMEYSNEQNKELTDKLARILRTNEAWSLVDVLEKLTHATDFLLHKKDFDGDRWEEMEHCYKLGKEIIESLKQNQ